MHRGGFSLLTNYRMRRSVAISLRYYGFFGELRFGIGVLRSTGGAASGRQVASLR